MANGDQRRISRRRRQKPRRKRKAGAKSTYTRAGNWRTAKTETRSGKPGAECARASACATDANRFANEFHRAKFAFFKTRKSQHGADGTFFSGFDRRSQSPNLAASGCV